MVVKGYSALKPLVGSGSGWGKRRQAWSVGVKGSTPNEGRTGALKAGAEPRSLVNQSSPGRSRPLVGRARCRSPRRVQRRSEGAVPAYEACETGRSKWARPRGAASSVPRVRLRHVPAPACVWHMSGTRSCWRDGGSSGQRPQSLAPRTPTGWGERCAEFLSCFRLVPRRWDSSSPLHVRFLGAVTTLSPRALALSRLPSFSS